eukprot:761318-Hanusia_phi.AAC.3
MLKNLVEPAQDLRARVLVVPQVQLDSLPALDHPVKGSLDHVLLARQVADLGDLGHVILQLHLVEDCVERDVVVEPELDLEVRRQRLPMSVLHPWVPQSGHHRHVLLEVIYVVSNGLGHLEHLLVPCLEHLGDLEQVSPPHLYVLFDLLGIKRGERAGLPGAPALLKLHHGVPQGNEGLEGLRGLLDAGVVRLRTG